MKRTFVLAALAALLLPVAWPHGGRVQAQSAVVKPVAPPPATPNSGTQPQVVTTSKVSSQVVGAGAAVQPAETASGDKAALTAKGKAATTQPAAAPATGGSWFTFLMLGAAAILVIMLIRGPRKEEKKRKLMLSAMKKGSRVVTIGGLVGSVVEVRDDVVVLKVDESANVKAHYLKSAISRVIADDDSPEEKKR